MQLGDAIFWGVIGIFIIFVFSKIVRRFPGAKRFLPIMTLHSTFQEKFPTMWSGMSNDLGLGNWADKIQRAWEKAGEENVEFAKKLFEPGNMDDSILGSDTYMREWEEVGRKDAEIARRLFVPEKDDDSEPESDTYMREWEEEGRKDAEIARRLFVPEKKKKSRPDDDYSFNDWEDTSLSEMKEISDVFFKDECEEKKPRKKSKQRKNDEEESDYDPLGLDYLDEYKSYAKDWRF